RPFLLASDEPIIEMQDMLRPGVSAPNPAMVTRDLQDVFKVTRLHVKKKLSVNRFAKHLVFDGWAAASRRSFMGIGVAFFDEEKISFRHLDLVPYVLLH
ncbi:hypothetical protein CYLTODRAFT_363603, partial [Cylindrobasidium torrendii FP15055 ss-10]